MFYFLETESMKGVNKYNTFAAQSDIKMDYAKDNQYHVRIRYCSQIKQEYFDVSIRITEAILLFTIWCVAQSN